MTCGCRPRTTWKSSEGTWRACGPSGSTASGASPFPGRTARRVRHKSGFAITIKRSKGNDRGEHTMLPTKRVSTHPGELLKREYLDEMGITQVAFAKHCG